MATPQRPSFIANWSEIERPHEWHYDQDDEPMAIGASLNTERFSASPSSGFITRDCGPAGAHPFHMPRAQRKSLCTSSKASLMSGSTAICIDSSRAMPLDFRPARHPHIFLNNTEAEVHLLVVGERSKPENRIFYPLNSGRKALHADWWDDHPRRLGPSRRIAGPLARREGSAAS